MGWQTEITRIIRYMINDIDPVTPTYTDENIIEITLTAVQLITSQMDFTQNFIQDFDAQNIIPDPTDRVGTGGGPTRDDSFINLVCMQAACLVERMEAKLAGSQAVEIRDSGSAVSLRGPAQSKIKLLGINWCKALDEAKQQYRISKTHIAAAAICSPFRVWAGDGRTIYPNAGAIDFRP